MPSPKTRRAAPVVNAGSMADIAFLLLIFFLVTTTIAEDKGILVKLPEWSNEPSTLPYPEDKVLTVLINKYGELLVEDQVVARSRVQGLLEEHLRTPGAVPGSRIVSLTHDRETNYGDYLAVYDALRAGYHAIWEELAQTRYGRRYDDLSKAEQTDIRARQPMVISEAEPTAL